MMLQMCSDSESEGSETQRDAATKDDGGGDDDEEDDADFVAFTAFPTSTLRATTTTLRDGGSCSPAGAEPCIASCRFVQAPTPATSLAPSPVTTPSPSQQAAALVAPSSTMEKGPPPPLTAAAVVTAEGVVPQGTSKKSIAPPLPSAVDDATVTPSALGAPRDAASVMEEEQEVVCLSEDDAPDYLLITGGEMEEADVGPDDAGTCESEVATVLVSIVQLTYHAAASELY